MKRPLIITFIALLLISCQKEKDLMKDQQSESATEAQTSDVSISEIKKAGLAFINQSSKRAVARMSASNSNRGKQVTIQKEIKHITRKKSIDNQSSIYIINYENGGFVIMSDNKASQPILAYSDSGSFDPNDPSLNSGIKLWLDESLIYVNEQKNSSDKHSTVINEIEWNSLLNESASFNTANTYNYDSQRLAAMNQRMYELMQASDMTTTVVPLTSAASYLPPDRLAHFKSIAQSKGSPEQYTIVEIINKTSSTEIDQLMKTHWYQSGIFGQQVPNGLAGCTATAAGQIMNYYKYPSSFNWNNMTNANLHNNNDVALFMKTLGQKFDMDYDSDGSGASIDDVKSGLQSYGYNVIQKDHTYEDVKNSLKQNTPVYLTGCINTTFLGLIYKDCHAWVAEGLRQYNHDKAFRIEWQTNSYTYNTDGIEYFQIGDSYTYFYMNWGWGENYNGWFTSLNLENQTGSYFKHRQRNLYITKP